MKFLKTIIIILAVAKKMKFLKTIFWKKYLEKLTKNKNKKYL
jgi:hypothetical protein